MHNPHVPALGLLAFAVSGCMFDIVSVPQKSTVFTPLIEDAKNFKIDAGHVVQIGTGFRTQLKAGTTWNQIGSIPQGEVYRSPDQILVVEASNIHEAALVVNDGQVVGFFLLVEKTFCPAKQPTQIK